MPSSVPQEIPEKILRQECFNIRTLPTKSNGEVKPSSEHSKHLNNNYPEYSPKALADIQFKKEIQNFPDSYDQLTSENGIGTDDGLAFHKVEEYKEIEREEDEQSIDSSVTDSDAFNSEDSYDSRYDSYFSEKEALTELRAMLTKDEKSLINQFNKEIEGIKIENDANYPKSILESIRNLTDKYLEKGIRLNAKCSSDRDSISDLILKKIISTIESISCNDEEQLDDNSWEIVSSILTKLMFKLCGRVQRDLFYNKKLWNASANLDTDFFAGCKRIENKLKKLIYQSIVNKDELTQNDFAAEMDNCYFYIKYPQKSIVRVATITNSQEIKDSELLDLRIGVLQIGESIIRVESIGGKRNYTDIFKGSIKMSFTTEIEGKAEKISIHLYPNKTDNKKIKVKLDQENQEKFNKLKNKSSLGKNCLLGGKNIVKAIQDKEFTKNESYKPYTLPTLLEETSISNVFGSLRNKCEQFGKYVLGGEFYRSINILIL